MDDIKGFWLPVALLTLVGWAWRDAETVSDITLAALSVVWASWEAAWWLWTPLALLWMWRVHRADMAESRRHTLTWRAAQAAWEEKRP
jgi:hypothetical protein